MELNDSFAKSTGLDQSPSCPATSLTGATGVASQVTGKSTFKKGGVYGNTA